jgi:hypothetical protein
MTIYAPPAKSSISAPYPNPSNAVARIGFGALWDYVTSLLGMTGTPADAIAALGAVDTSTAQTIAGVKTLSARPICNGGVNLGSNGQLQFPAVQNVSSDANTLDDYEEGTWTPVDTSGAGLTFSTATGVYTKIGRLVTVIGRVVWPANASGLQGKVGGLPFGSAAGFPGFATQWCTFTQGLNGRLDTTTSFYVTTITGGGPSNALLAGSEIQFTATYMTA